MEKNILYHKNFPEEKTNVILGIDEAGRGPVIGPLVYGMLISSNNLESEIFADSKTLTPIQRKKIFNHIETNYPFAYHIISPEYLNVATKNLNEISFDAVFALLDIAMKYFNVTDLYIDTIGTPNKLRDMIKTRFNIKNVVVSIKADSKYKIVGGASIIAKCIRDGQIELIDENLGSGYPSDPVTIEYLKNLIKQKKEFPSFVRRKWKTLNRLRGLKSGTLDSMFIKK